VTFLNERIVVMEEIIQSSNESHRLTTEKLEQEKQAYSNRANEAEAKVHRTKLSQVRECSSLKYAYFSTAFRCQVISIVLLEEEGTVR
jgi:hypothetical protein